MPAHDLIGIGLGPANLGLACLSAPLEDLDAVFLESRPDFSWHPGMLLPSATLQTPFLADLVTLADPTSPYSFLSYLKQTGRLYPFYIRESFFPLRREYDDYCRWAAQQLMSVRFGTEVTRVDHDGKHYVVESVTDGVTSVRRAKHLVLGTGSRPSVPVDVEAPHTADYLHRKDELLGKDSVTVVGSGQSAAEVFFDLLSAGGDRRLTWVTRSPRFFPLEYTKLTLEMTSPDYVDHFHALDEDTRYRLDAEQHGLYKGIDASLINAIYDLLYEQRVCGGPEVRLLTSTELLAASYDGQYRLVLRQQEQGRELELTTDGLVLATGYDSSPPAFLEPIRDRLTWDGRGRLDIARNYSVDVTGREVFLQNGGTHRFSVTSPDLGMCAYRNSWILREVLGREVYPIEKRVAFQDFGV